MTAAEANKELVVRFVEEFWSRGNMDAAEALMAPDVIIHSPEVGSVTGLKAFCGALRTAFPDWNSTVEEMVADEERVAERWTGRGTHRGEFQGIPPSGNGVAVPGVVFYRVRDGRIVEFRGSFDMLSMLRQLGVGSLPAVAAR